MAVKRFVVFYISFTKPGFLCCINIKVVLIILILTKNNLEQIKKNRLFFNHGYRDYNSNMVVSFNGAADCLVYFKPDADSQRPLVFPAAD